MYIYNYIYILTKIHIKYVYKYIYMYMVVRVLSGYDCIRSIPISHHALVFGPFGG
jgi:hypothetical protein